MPRHLELGQRERVVQLVDPFGAAPIFGRGELGVGALDVKLARAEEATGVTHKGVNLRSAQRVRLRLAVEIARHSHEGDIVCTRQGSLARRGIVPVLFEA